MTSTRIALVTGAANGIGRAIALRLASDGLDVAVNDIASNQDKLQTLVNDIRLLQRRAILVIGDVSVEDDVAAMVKKTVNELGCLDVMIANAGICQVKPFMETTAQEWARMFTVNAQGMFFCYQHAAKQMIAQGRGGRIVGASSSSGKQAEAMMTAYSATKFAIRGLSQGAALELGQHGITVNAYAPGAIETPLTRGLAETMIPGPDAWEQVAKIESSRNPLGMIGQPADVANIVSFLVSDQASFITGQTISVNGGRVLG